jgi:hypothetical protein
MVAILIFLRRPRPRGSGGIAQDGQATATADVTVPGEPLSEGIIRSPVAGPVTTDSGFQCQVGEMIFLEAEEQLHVREDKRPCDICICVILHCTKKRDTA